MSNPIRILNRCRGLNNYADPSNILCDLDKGEYELAEAINVVIQDGNPERRKGRTRVSSTAFHSLYALPDCMVGVTGDALSIIHRDYTSTPIRNVTPGAKMSYAQAGPILYYANGYETGFIQDKLSHSWVHTRYVGPETTRVFSSPPIGSSLCIFKGIMYVAVGHILWYSEPFAFNTFDNSKNFIDFGSDITMVGRSEDTLYVSNQSTVYAHFGAGPKEFSQSVAFRFPAIKGTDCGFDFTELPILQDNFGRGLIWTGTKGICIGANRGVYVVLTTRKLKYPKAVEGNAVLFENNYIVNLIN